MQHPGPRGFQFMTTTLKQDYESSETVSNDVCNGLHKPDIQEHLDQMIWRTESYDTRQRKLKIIALSINLLLILDGSERGLTV